MTTPKPIYDPELPSLADLRRQIEARHDLPLLRRRDIISTIRTLAGWFKLPEENVPASAKYIRDMLARVHVITANVSPRRIQNVRSLVLSSLHRSECGPWRDQGAFIQLGQPPRVLRARDRQEPARGRAAQQM